MSIATLVGAPVVVAAFISCCCCCCVAATISCVAVCPWSFCTTADGLRVFPLLGELLLAVIGCRCCCCCCCIGFGGVEGKWGLAADIRLEVVVLELGCELLLLVLIAVVVLMLSGTEHWSDAAHAATAAWGLPWVCICSMWLAEADDTCCSWAASREGTCDWPPAA